jgi:diaminopropionate ammonia-lyase
MRVIPAAPFLLERNRNADHASAECPPRVQMVCRQFEEDAWREIQCFPGYAATPLRKLARLSAAAQVDSIHYKDEAGRFGLGSFKAVGSAYGLIRAIRRHLENRGLAQLSAAALLDGSCRDAVSHLTVTCATDGNHGRAVAWGARLAGTPCVVFLPSSVTAGRERAIADLGASTVRVDGTYDDAVRRAALEADRRGWIVVPDTSPDETHPTPIDVICGYMAVAHEAAVQLGVEGETLSHVFVQAGVGGLAAAVCAYFWHRWGIERPRFIVVEPDRADCFLQSARLGRPTTVAGDLDTIMAGLACAGPSMGAWQILERGADFFMAIPDRAAIATMRLLNDGSPGSEGIVAGESGVAGLAAFLLCAGDDRARQSLQIDTSSRILVIGTEGATDAATYANILSASHRDTP